MNNKFRKNLLAGVSAIGLIAAMLTAPALASERGPEASGPAAESGHRWHSSGRSPERIKEMFARRQAELQGKLNLRPDQEPAWQAFVTAVTPAGSSMHIDRAAWKKMTATERMEKKLALLKEREAILAGQLVATKTFYAALTPEQQKIFDENFMTGRRYRKG